MVYKFVNKMFSAGSVKSEIMSNKELADELHKLVIRKFKNEKYTYPLKILFGLLILPTCN